MKVLLDLTVEQKVSILRAMALESGLDSIFEVKTLGDMSRNEFIRKERERGRDDFSIDGANRKFLEGMTICAECVL